MAVGGEEGEVGIAYSIKRTCARKHADRQRDKQTDKSPLVSSSSPLSSRLFCSFFFSATLAVLLFSLWDETQDGTLCCLCAFNICLPLTTFSPLLYLFLCWLFSPRLSLTRAYLCSCLLCVQSLHVPSTWAVFSLPFCFSLWLFLSVSRWQLCAPSFFIVFLSCLSCSVQQHMGMIVPFSALSSSSQPVMTCTEMNSAG